MKWIKKGLVWAPDKNSEMLFSYGILPVPLFLPDMNIVRVFFGSADKNIQSRIYSLDLNPNNLSEVFRYPEKPVLDIGSPGTFDDTGVVPSSIIEVGNKLYLYTVGFQRCVNVPYMLFGGVAISDDNGTHFQRPHQAPILPRMPHRAFSQGAPSVLVHEGKFKMWHWFATKWFMISGKFFMDYKIGYAESNDGIKWEMKDITCLKADESKGEFAVARPFVIFEDRKFKMWYSIRYNELGYRMGYAESIDGLKWIRKDELAGIDVSTSGWDSEMICYPAVIDILGKRYLFYNGNNNGETGFGYAELSDI